MRRKWRLVTSIIVMVLVFALMVFAIVGAVTNIGIDGDIFINGENLEVTISGKIYGHNKNHMTEETADEIGTVTWNLNTPTEDGENRLDWTDLPLNFVEKDSEIVILITIKNNHLSNSVLVGVEDKTAKEGKNFTVAIESSGTEVQDTIGLEESIVYKITLSIVDPAKIVEGNLNVIFSLTNVEIDG